MSPRARSKSTNPPAESRLTRLRRRFYRPGILLIVGMLPMSVVLVAALRRSLPDLASRPEYQVTADSIDVETPPWIPGTFVANVFERADLPETLSLLDDALVGDLAGAFAASPWVERVESVRKQPTGRVQVQLAFRRPVATVRLNRISYPIDAAGVLLPVEDLDPVATRRLPTIVGINTPVGPLGDAWVDPVVHGAARLAEAIADDWNALGFQRIRVRAAESIGREARDLVYEIITAENSVIVWGRAPGSTHPGELSVAQKLGKLSRYLEKYESFEKPNGPYEIDIRHWREITRQRIVTGPRRART